LQGQDVEGFRGLNREALSERLRARRRELGLTLKEVADRAGLSVGFISQIERAITTPSLSSLVGVSRVLGLQISDFVSHPRVIAPTTRHNERPHYAVGSNSLVYERLSASFPGSVLSTVIIHEPPGHRSEPIAHEGEEIFYVLEGGVTVEIDGQPHVLGVGDSVHFASTRVHSAWNHLPTPSTLLHTCTMDVFGDRHDADQEPGSRRKSGRSDDKSKAKLN